MTGMNDLSVTQTKLPQTLPELAKFALVGREKLSAVRAEIRAIQKVGLAKEVLEQKLEEAQEIAELVTLSEMQIGKMMKEIPKATPNNNPHHEFVPQDNLVKPKSEAVRDLGFTPKQTAQFQQMADHEAQVHEAIAEARQNDEVVSRTAVMRKIAKAKPHVANNSTDNEWYTPKCYIELARQVMGSIDLDPASNDFANETINASVYYTEERDGLEQEWFGNIWMNPPYSTALLQKFADKLSISLFNQAIVLVNNATETAWFEKLVSRASAIVFHKGRIRFVKRDGEHGSPLQGQAFLYFGDNPEKFLSVFRQVGWGAKL